MSFTPMNQERQGGKSCSRAQWGGVVGLEGLLSVSRLSRTQPSSCFNPGHSACRRWEAGRMGAASALGVLSLRSDHVSLAYCF